MAEQNGWLYEILLASCMQAVVLYLGRITDDGGGGISALGILVSRVW